LIKEKMEGNGKNIVIETQEKTEDIPIKNE